MIVEANIKGFKRFKNARFKFAPLTVLTGLNGTGKSSLIQALLLAQEASTNSANSLRLNGPFGMELGTAEDVLNWDSSSPIHISLKSSDESTLKWTFKVPSEDAMYLDVEQMPDSFLEAPRTFTYLSAERLGPRSISATSALSEAEIEVGTNGEYCAHVLSVLGSRILQDNERSHPLYDGNDGSSVRLVKYEVEQWLSEIARPVEINSERLHGSTVAELKFRAPGSTWVRSTNMGFGVTYALPIILAGIILERDGLLVVENPEAHLHPAGQSRMGVFLAWLAGRGVQVLVETHSDHLLNGIRRGIAEFAYLDSASAIVHWFGGFEPDNDEFEAIGLQIDAAGSLSGWPKGFFDQYQLDVASLGRGRRTRR